MKIISRLYLLLFLPLFIFQAARSQPLCTVTRYDEDSGLSQGHVTQMLQDKDGFMWFATWNGLDRFDGVEFTNFKPRPGDGCDMPSVRFRDLRQLEDGQLYCLAETSWYRFNRKDGSFHAATTGQIGQLKQNLHGRGARGTAHQVVEHRDRQGRQWKLDHDGRLFYEERSGWREYPLKEPLSGALFFMSDRQGNLWLLMKASVVKLSFSENPVSHFPQERQAQVRCLFLDRQHRYWVCTRDDSTVRLFSSDNQPLGYLTPNGTLVPTYTSFSSPVYCMTQTADGNIWMGSKPDGLYALTPRGAGFVVRKLKGMLPSDDVYDIKEDRQGRLWVATMGGGVCCIVNPLGERPQVFSSLSGFRSYPKTVANRVRFIHITSAGVLLAATTEGLLVGKIPDGDIASMSFRLHQRESSRAESLSNNATMDVLETSDNRIFVSTESGGVSEIITRDLLAPQLEFRHNDKRNGLASDIALSMTENDGQLWIVGNNQLMSLHADGTLPNAFDHHFFHAAYRFSEAHPLKLPDGRWLFGLVDGAFVAPASIVSKSDYVPNIVLTAVDCQGGDALHAVNHLHELVLEPSERNLTISFAALDYGSPDAVSYAFRMEGDDEWNYIGHNHTASFAELTPGTYKLQLRSTNGDGVWVDNVRQLTIVVTPTFWESWLGRSLVVLLLTALASLAVYTYLYIRRINRKHKETLEAYLALLAQPPTSANIPSKTPSASSQPESALPKSELSTEDEAFMGRVVAFVEQHIGDAEANIGDMAEAAATSRSGLNRKLKSLIGLTPADFMREARIKRACQLLATTDMAVADVAFKCGFTDPKYFGKCFKSSTGLSPTDFRITSTKLPRQYNHQE